MAYIDRDKLNEAMYHEAFEKTSDLQRWDSGCWIRYKLFENVLKSIPTADVVEVVRCKDCKHRGYIVKDRRGYEWIEYEETSHCPLQCYDDDYYNRLSEDDFFCADGERREDG